MKKILVFIFIIVIFIIGGIFGYKKILSIEKENKIIQLFNKDSLENFSKNFSQATILSAIISTYLSKYSI